MAKTKTIAELLNKAADELEKHGWRQKEYGTSRGAKCITAAVHFASNGAMPRSDLSFSSVTNEGLDLLEASIPKSFYSLVQWNDRKGRTKEQVIRLLRRVAKKAEKNES